MTPIIGDVMFITGKVADTLVDAVHTDRGEVVAQRPKVALRVREKSLINVTLNDLALDFKTCLSQIQKMVEPVEKPLFIALKEVTQTSAVNRHHAQRTRLFSRTEKTVAAL